MKRWDIRRWWLPLVTGVVLLAALLLPRQISAYRDQKALGSVHVEALAEEDLHVQEASIPEKLELLGRAIQYPNLEVYSSVQPLEHVEESEEDTAEKDFREGVAYLESWGILPENFDGTSLAFQGGSRVVYVQADGALSASMLHLQGRTDRLDDFWMVVDEETGLPLWIDCTFRSAKGELCTAEQLGERFLRGLELESTRRGPNVWEIEGAGGLAYSAFVGQNSGRISVEPLGFVWEIFEEGGSGETEAR